MYVIGFMLPSWLFKVIFTFSVFESYLVAGAFFEVSNVNWDLDLGRSYASQEEIRDILNQEGIVAVTGVPRLAATRETVLKAAANCVLRHGAAPLKVQLKDGSTRFSWAAFVDHMQTEPIPDVKECPDLNDAIERLQSIVTHASIYFSHLLDESMLRQDFEDGLFQKSDGGSYSTFTEIVSEGKHLDHLHVYDNRHAPYQPSLETLELHTDLGLFIAFVPSLRVTEYGAFDKEEDSFLVERKDGSLVLAKFPMSGDVLVFMIGEGFNLIPSQAIYPAYALPHALSLKTSSLKSLRAWFGRMFFTPRDALLSARGETFHSIVDQVLRFPLKDVAPIGCESKSKIRRRLQDGTGQNCSAGELYCWLSCQSTKDLPCNSDEVSCRSSNGDLWMPCDDCHDFSARLVCPTSAPTPVPDTEVAIDSLLTLRYNINNTHGSFTLVCGESGYIAFGIGESMTRSKVIIGMDPMLNPGLPAVGLYTIMDAAGDLAPIAMSPQELGQYGIVQHSFSVVNQRSTLRFTIEASYQNSQFSLLQNNLNIIYAVGPVTYSEHDSYGVRYSVDFSASGFTNNKGTSLNTNGFYSVDSLLAAHVVLMTLAWQVISPIGVAVPLFNNPKYLRRPVCPLHAHWFKIHWMLQAVAVAIGSLGSVLGFLHVQSRQSYHWNTPHKMLGLVVLLISIFQPLLGHFRPHLADKRSRARLAFELFHPLLGYSLVLLAMVNAALGIQEFAILSGEARFISFTHGTTSISQGYQSPLGVIILLLLVMFVVLVLFGKLQTILGFRRIKSTIEEGANFTRNDKVVDLQEI